MSCATVEKYASPRVNIMESSDVITIEAELPGVPKEGAGVEVKDGVLILTGERTPSLNDSTLKVQERPRAEFYRRFRLGDMVDPERVDAKMNDGVLTVTLPKSEKWKKRTVSIN